jgi:hypothetical protein
MENQSGKLVLQPSLLCQHLPVNYKEFNLVGSTCWINNSNGNNSIKQTRAFHKQTQIAQSLAHSIHFSTVCWNDSLWFSKYGIVFSSFLIHVVSKLCSATPFPIDFVQTSFHFLQNIPAISVTTSFITISCDFIFHIKSSANILKVHIITIHMFCK